jgi:HPt (histidine-containing phosphotransfer) domain-containing protein
MTDSIMTDQPNIDWHRVAELRSEVGEDGFDEVVELFLEEVDEVTGRLRTMSGVSGLREELHFLKGSALNLGFARFAALCAQGEALAARGEAALVDLPALLSAYARARAAFTTGLTEGRAA